MLPHTVPMDGNDPASNGNPIDRPVLVCLHFLGGSARTWDLIIDRLSHAVRCVAIDLPGFGEAAHRQEFSVEQMAEVVAGIIRSEAPRRWMLAGHSMGAKVATVLARRAENGEAGLEGLSHLILLAGSPPAPEPMDESRRETMAAWFTGHPDEWRREAQEFVEQNIATPLVSSVHESAIDDVLRANRDAWVAWLETGSREDWSDRIGLLQTPTLIVAGEKDGDLGVAAQRRLMVPHFAHAEIVTVADAGHLLPIEKADEVSILILRHTASASAASLDPDFRALIGSDRVSARTRQVLLARAKPDDRAYRSVVLSQTELATLRAVVDQIAPQPLDSWIDLAARIDTALTSGKGDGWRFAALPRDVEAWQQALRTLDTEARRQWGTDFVQLDSEERDRVLGDLAIGRSDDRGLPPGGPGRLNAEQMKLWFEDVRAETAKAYMAHPATLARIGYSGFAYGGDGDRLQGFVRIGRGEREAWEPEAKPDVAR